MRPSVTVSTSARSRPASVPKSRGDSLAYDPQRGLDEFVADVSAANAVQLAWVERNGVSGVFLKDLSARTNITFQRISEILGIPRATAADKAKTGAAITGAGSHAAVGFARLLARAQQIVDNSTAVEADEFDVPRWLGEWIEIPQPSLGGRRPADLLDTPSGLDAVMRVIGALESGAYQ
jgi:putative toxin-antitoxin system antitoxin component (TIGR02293 family)